MNVYKGDYCDEVQQFEFVFGSVKTGAAAIRIGVIARSRDDALSILKEAVDRVYSIDIHDEVRFFEICLNPDEMTVDHIVDSEEHAS